MLFDNILMVDYLNMLMFILYYLIEVLMILLSVAFVTLLERKILGLIQWRYGPNKVGFMGVLQPFADAIKLLSKSKDNIFIDMYMYYFMPVGMLFLMLFIWMLFPVDMMEDFNYSVLMMLVCLSLGVYPIMIGGWNSGSSYSYLGSLRSVAQMISYEISFLLILIPFFINMESFNFSVYESNGFMNMFMIPLDLMLFISMLIELNRTPADLIEGESELVSGFNIEYYGVGFTMIFLAEYGMILMMSYFYVLMVLGLNGFYFSGVFLVVMIVMIIIMIRGVLPRIRYDQLMNMCWMVFLPLSLGYMFMVIGMKCDLIYFY